MCKYRVTYHSHHRNFSAVCMRTLIFVAIRPLNRQQQRHGRWYPEGGECGCSAAHAAPPAPPPLPPRPGSDGGHAQARLTSRERRDQQESPHTGEGGRGSRPPRQPRWDRHPLVLLSGGWSGPGCGTGRLQRSHSASCPGLGSCISLGRERPLAALSLCNPFSPASGPIIVLHGDGRLVRRLGRPLQAPCCDAHRAVLCHCPEVAVISSETGKKISHLC